MNLGMRTCRRCQSADTEQISFQDPKRVGAPAAQIEEAEVPETLFQCTLKIRIVDQVLFHTFTRPMHEKLNIPSLENIP
jgi:hypothetical protein